MGQTQACPNLDHRETLLRIDMSDGVGLLVRPQCSYTNRGRFSHCKRLCRQFLNVIWTWRCAEILLHCTSGSRTAMSPDCVIYRTQGKEGYCSCDKSQQKATRDRRLADQAEHLGVNSTCLRLNNLQIANLNPASSEVRDLKLDADR